MTDHADDQWVQKMAKYILGTDDYDNKFSRAKGTFTAIKAYEREPSQSQPQDDAWKSVRSSADVEIYCGGSRYTKPQGALFWKDGAMDRPVLKSEKDLIDNYYKTDFAIGSGAPATKAVTKSSNFVNIKDYIFAKQADPNTKKSDYTVPKPSIACTMDICTWFTTLATSDGWPTINTERVDKCKTDEFKAGLKYGSTPVDGLKTIGSTMLHELTHTDQGGQLIDVPEDQRPENVESCYNWVCIGGLKNERNADSIAMLGMAMKL